MAWPAIPGTTAANPRLRNSLSVQRQAHAQNVVKDSPFQEALNSISQSGTVNNPADMEPVGDWVNPENEVGRPAAVPSIPARTAQTPSQPSPAQSGGSGDPFTVGDPTQMDPMGDWVNPSSGWGYSSGRGRTNSHAFNKAFTSSLTAAEDAATERQQNKRNATQADPQPTPQPNPSDPYSVYGITPAPNGYTTGPAHSGAADARANPFNPWAAFNAKPSSMFNQWNPFRPGGMNTAQSGSERWRASQDSYYKSRYLRPHGRTPFFGIGPEDVSLFNQFGIAGESYRVPPLPLEPVELARRSVAPNVNVDTGASWQAPLEQSYVDVLRMALGGIDNSFAIPRPGDPLWDNYGRFLTHRDTARLSRQYHGLEDEDGNPIPRVTNEEWMRRMGIQPGDSDRSLSSALAEDRRNGVGQVYPDNLGNGPGGGIGYYYGGNFYPWGALRPLPRTPAYRSDHRVYDWQFREGSSPDMLQQWSHLVPNLPPWPSSGPGWSIDANGRFHSRGPVDYQPPPNVRLIGPGEAHAFRLPEGSLIADGYRANGEYWRIPYEWNPPLPSPDEPLPPRWNYNARSNPPTVVDPLGRPHAWPYDGPPSQENPPQIRRDRQNPRPPDRPQSLAPTAPSPQEATYTLRTNPGGTLNNPTPAQTHTFTQAQLDSWLDENFGGLNPAVQQSWINQVVGSITPSSGAAAATWHGNPLSIASGQLSAADPVLGSQAAPYTYSASPAYSQPTYNQYLTTQGQPQWQSLVTYNPGGGGSGLYGSPYGYIGPSVIDLAFGDMGAYGYYPQMSGILANSMLYPPGYSPYPEIDPGSYP